MTLSEQLTDYVNACFPGIYVQSFEPDEAEREIVHHAQQQKWKVASWDIENGLRLPVSPGTPRHDAGLGDPLAVLRALPGLAEPNGTALLLLHNFHRYLQTAEVMQSTFAALLAGKQQRTFIVVLSAVVAVRVELEKLFVILHHELPGREQLERIARELTSDSPNDLPHGEALQRVLDAAAGLTRYEAEGSFALSIARHGTIRPDVVTTLKSQMLAKSGLCSLYQGEVKSFDTLQGVDHIRHLTRQLLRLDCPVPPKGWLFVGPPNIGKTTVAKAIATDNHMPLILADLPSLKAKFVGESEGRVRRFISLCEAMGPCCVLLDEVEDALAGATAEQAGDSGVSRDQLSAILKWRSESKARVFLTATCNEPERLLQVKQGALFRDGRFFDQLQILALIHALADLAVVKGDDSGAPLDLGTKDIAARFVEVYWQQSRPFQVSGQNTSLILQQNTGKQAAIISQIVESQQKCGASLFRLKQTASDRWSKLVVEVDQVVREMPLWKLQTVGNERLDFLYDNLDRGSTIALKPGVAYCLRAFYELVRDLIEGAWVRYVQKVNANKLGNLTDLGTFLFGQERADIDTYRPILMDVQQGVCLYCQKALTKQTQLDHFIPWSRYPADIGHNFVLAHNKCNNAKLDYLAAEKHLTAWAERNRVHQAELQSRLQEAALPYDSAAAVQIAEWVYWQTEKANGQVWVMEKVLQRLGPTWRQCLVA